MSLSDKKKIVYPDLGEMGVIGYEVLMPEDVKEAIKRIKKRLCPELIEELEGGLAMFKKGDDFIPQATILGVINEEMGEGLVV